MNTKRIRAGSSELRKLQRQLRPGVYLVAQGTGGHAKVCDENGLVRDERGMPVTLPGSPSPGSLRTAQRRLAALGLLA